MPKELTHWMLAEQALELLPAGGWVQKTIASHRNAYLGGAVLPDTLAHIFRGPYHPTARQLGQRFHDAAGNSFAPLIRAEQRFPEGMPPELRACLFGVISHMKGDIVLHPWVYAATGSAGIGEHYRLETAMDVHFLRRGKAAPRRLERLLSPATREVMVIAAGALFDPDGVLPRAALESSLALHCRFQGMYHRTRWKLAARVLGKLCGSPLREQRHLFYPLRPSGGMRIAAVEGGSWRHPESGELRNSSLEALARDAVERTVAVFQRVEAAGSFAAALHCPPGANLLTGLHGVTKEKA